VERDARAVSRYTLASIAGDAAMRGMPPQVIAPLKERHAQLQREYEALPYDYSTRPLLAKSIRETEALIKRLENPKQ
jgi:hypothetical protein